MLTRTILALCLLFSASALAVPRGPVKVSRIVDGDTLHVVGSDDDDVTVRVLGIDCPESRKVKKCGKYREGLPCKDEIQLGKKATAAARKLLQGATVTLESGGSGKDPFHRQLLYVRLQDGRDFGLTMIEQGYCRDFGWKYPHLRGEQYKAAQR